ncbi:MAG: DUF2867 domain-containing protein [Halomonas sp.]|uniref:DUF2867 domain-containing protein n=1 Tax=Halomonas sp. TaxID=1486246 RepID=UPI0019D898D7|nr:DUF2867 domain-containing protein [Halomonas sp.]MBE0488631.1 DUF2867 domain-containing protein [Halomonas sp.]
MSASDPLWLVFGASGYVGRNMVPHLVAQGRRVRAVARRLSAMEAEGWQGVDQVRADALDPATLAPALAGVEVAFYLVHSMGGGRGFPARDREAARNFAKAAAEAGVSRIIYLGGLAPEGADTEHLSSRVETGEILRAGPVPVVELRAGIIIGAGSAAFEVMRDLVAHLPIMVTPRWVSVSSPPMALDDLLADLVGLAALPEAEGGVFETGGPERQTYAAMMRGLARGLGRRRPIIVPVPFMTPKLSSYWMDLVTGVPAPLARALIGGLRHDLRANDTALRALVPRDCLGFDAAVAKAFEAERGMLSGDRWREGAFDLRGYRHDISFYGKRMTLERHSSASPAAAWETLEGLATRASGYFALTPIWRLRAAANRLLRGADAGPRQHAGPFAEGETFGFWRVHRVRPGERLILLSSLRAPGEGGMEITLEPDTAGGSRITLVLHWHPAGVWGLLYWFLLWPAHAVVLRAFLRGLGRAAAQEKMS